MCAIREMLFDVTSRTMLVTNLSGPIQGAQVNLIATLEWCIREMRLHQLDGIGGNLQITKLDFNLKLDGRPFWGKNTIDFHVEVMGLLMKSAAFFASYFCVVQ